MTNDQKTRIFGPRKSKISKSISESIQDPRLSLRSCTSKITRTISTNPLQNCIELIDSASIQHLALVRDTHAQVNKQVLQLSPVCKPRIQATSICSVTKIRFNSITNMMATSAPRTESVGMNGLHHAYFRDMILSTNNQPQQSQL